MWHLGCVNAACLASLGHEVVGFDQNAQTIAELQKSRAPLFEPGLNELIAQQSKEGRLAFSSEPERAVAGAQVVWIAYDTPVDEDDVADVTGVVDTVHRLLAHAQDGAVVIVSSQLIAGCTRELERRCAESYADRRFEFAYSPENLRLGKAIEVFLDPDRVVMGVNSERARTVITEVMESLSTRILWMSVESAEMTKHAINAFLAMCVSFSNEIAIICEFVGADAKQVELGLKSEKRIGPSAYVAPGAAFAGGTLARDVQYLKLLSRDADQPGLLLNSIKESNDRHRNWVQRKLTERFGTLHGKRIAVLGLTYKPDTDTLRRSTSVELCTWLTQQGADVVAHDPRVRELPPELASRMELQPDLDQAMRNALAIVIATPWPEYKTLSAERVRKAVDQPVVIDLNRCASGTLDVERVEYLSVGSPAKHRF
jgi:UDPglucose 6-dehydrogenase